MSHSATAQEVLERHLELSRAGDDEAFLRSYRKDSFLIMRAGVRRGLEEIRSCFEQLNRELPNAHFSYSVVTTEQEVGFVQWTAESDAHVVEDGVDTYLIQDGYIRAQTIHYTLRRK